MVTRPGLEPELEESKSSVLPITPPGIAIPHCGEAENTTKGWLPGLDSNQEWKNQNLQCYQLHHRVSDPIAMSVQ